MAPISACLTIAICFSSSSIHAGDFSQVYRNLSDSDFIPFDVDEDGDLDILVTNPRPFTSGPASTAVYYQEANNHFIGPFAITLHPTPLDSPMLFGRRNTADPNAIYRLHSTQISQTEWTGQYIRYFHQDKHHISLGEITDDPFLNQNPHGGGHIDADDFLDVLYISPESGISISWGNGSETTPVFAPNENNIFESLEKITDFTGNGHKDILFKAEINGTSGLAILRQVSSRHFAPAELLRFTNDNPIQQYVWQMADLNGDGLHDLYRTTSNSNTSEYSFIYSLQTPSGFADEIATSIDHSVDHIIGIDSSTGTPAKVIYLHSTEGSPFEIRTFIYDNPAAITHHDLEVNLNQPFAFKGHSMRKLVDINQDGIRDIVLSLSWPDPGNQSWVTFAQLCIGFGKPDGGYDFSMHGYTPLTGSEKILADFNNDGYPDYLIGKTLPHQEYVLITNMNGDSWHRTRHLTELLPQQYKDASISIESLSSVDMDNDGIPDLNVRFRRSKTQGLQTSYTYYCAIALNNGNGTFHFPHPLPEAFLSGSINHECDIFDYADWDNDGDLDAMAKGFGWYENTGNTFSTSLNFIASAGTGVDPIGNPISLDSLASVTDIDDDGALDLVIPVTGHFDPLTPDSEPTRMTIVFGNGQGGIDQIITLPVEDVTVDPVGYAIVLPYAFFDLNQDGKKDLVFSKPVRDPIGNPIPYYHMAYNSANGRFQTFNPFPANNGYYGLTQIDYNGDGILDLAGPKGFTSPGSNGPVVSPEHVLNIPLTYPSLELTLDVDNDHDADFTLKPYHNFQELYTYKNPIVDSTDPVVRYALDSGLRASDTLPNADPENDGINNLTEFMFGGSPESMDSQAILPMLGASRGAPHPRLTAQFKMRHDLPAGREYRFSVSHDLSHWINIPHTDGVKTVIDGTWSNMQLTVDPANYLPSANKAFIKWEVK